MSDAETETAPRPFLKWAGGKRQLLPQILPRLPALIETYYEPFLGGGAVFFALAAAGRFRRAVLSDANKDLVNTYLAIRDETSTVLRLLREHEQTHSEAHFYAQRELPCDAGPVGAARFIYLNRTCFNGLYRVNKAGKFNVAFGKYKDPRIADAAGLEVAARALSQAEIVHCGYETTLARAGLGDVAYLDPPYLAVSETASFSAFHKDSFETPQHEALSVAMGECASRGVHVLLSNADTLESRRIFSIPGRTVEVIPARRNINSAGDKRGPVGEILVSIPVISTKKKASAEPEAAE